MLFVLLGLALALTGGSCGVMEPGHVEVVAQEGSEVILPCPVSPRSQSPHHAQPFQWVRRHQSGESPVCRREKSGLMYRGAGSGFAQRINCAVDYRLHISSVRKEDAGEYACSLQIDGRTIVQNVMLRIIKVSFSNPEPVEGASLNVTCHITPTPSYWKVSWRLNGQDYSTWSTFHKDMRVKKVSQHHRGNWTCLARHWVGTHTHTAEATQSLKVKGIENPPLDSDLVYASLGSSATLPCVFSQGLAPNVTWARLSQGTPLSTPPSSPSSDSSPSPSLPHSFTPQTASSVAPWDRSSRLEGVELGDEGRYRCTGSVEGTQVQRDMELVTARVLSSSSSKKSHGLTLTCKLSNDREVTRYEWVRVTYDNSSVATVTPVGEGETLKLPTPTADDIGEWVCRYHGKSGPLGNVTYHLQLTGGLEAGVLESQSPSGALVIGLTLLVLLVLLIALQMYRNHRRRKMILPYPALENIIHSHANQREERERQQMNKKKSGPVEECV